MGYTQPSSKGRPTGSSSPPGTGRWAAPPGNSPGIESPASRHTGPRRIFPLGSSAGLFTGSLAGNESPMMETVKLSSRVNFCRRPNELMAYSWKTYFCPARA